MHVFFIPFLILYETLVPILAPFEHPFCILFPCPILAQILHRFLINLETFLHGPNHVFYWKNLPVQFFNFHLLLRNMSNHRFAFPFWHNFGSLLAYFSTVFRYQFWDALFGCLFSDFWSKKVAQKVTCERVAGAFGYPRAPKATQRPPQNELFPASVFE